MSKTQLRRQLEHYGMHSLCSKHFNPDEIDDDYLRAVVVKARTYYLEGEKRLRKELFPPKKGATQG
jgi:hypothetical protein